MSGPSALALARELGAEELVFVQEPGSGLTAVVALHSTRLGPAVGGTRMRPYASLDAAACDALRLAQAMTKKAAFAGVPRGGGKAVILGDPAHDKSRALLQAYARVVDRFGGRFHTGADMGFDGRDVAVLSRHTQHVSYAAAGSKLDTAELAALGVASAIGAVAESLGLARDGLRVAVQGLGQVGYRLARRLAQAGARLSVADTDERRVERVTAELGAEVVEPEAIYAVEAEIFSPNAGGEVLGDETIPRLRCRAVVGAANDPLVEERHAQMLAERGIVYAPDYVVNAGGLLSLLSEVGEADEAEVVERVEGIGRAVADLLAEARAQGTTPLAQAERRVQERLSTARERGARRRAAP